MAVDSDTKKFLEEVKKGKPRKFVMICKGIKILSMVVYKKGTVEKYKKEAKKDGKGQFYHGVVDGKGLNISFKLLSADGYEEPPGKELILKDFLKTEAGMKFKPSYAIVEELPKVNESDEVETALESSTSDGVSESDNSLADQFRNRLTALVPQIKAVVGTPSGDEAKLKASEAGVFARKMDFVQANALLDQAETALKTPVSKSAESTNDESTAAGVEVDQPANLDEALAGWKVAQNKMAVKLRMVEKALSAADHPDVMNALLELKAVRSQLSGTPDTMQKVREIEKYLHQDEIVEDVCELADDIRTPLLAATAQLKSVL